MTLWAQLKKQEGNVEDIPDIDKEILDYLKAINLLPGIMTGVSCAGHPKQECKGRKGATTSPYVQLFFKDVDEGANFLTEIYKKDAMTMVGIASHARIGCVTVYCPETINELPLSEQRERFFTGIITMLRGVVK